MAARVDRTAAGAAAALLALVAMLVVGSVLQSPAAVWLISGGLLVVFCVALGVGVNGRAAGLIIDNRNRVSLSKLQAAAWTVLVLSALFAAAFARLRLGLADPLAVKIPDELLAVLGISAVSLVGTPLVLSVKSDQAAPPAQAAYTADRLGDAPDSLALAGKVYARKDPGAAQWLDIFRGEEVSNAASPDLSKVQQFLITVVVLAGYGGALWHAFQAPEVVKGVADPQFMAMLPAFPSSVVGLVGISHAGYLAYKAVPHGRSAASPDGAASDEAAADTAVG